VADKNLQGKRRHCPQRHSPDAVRARRYPGLVSECPASARLRHVEHDAELEATPAAHNEDLMFFPPTSCVLFPFFPRFL